MTTNKHKKNARLTTEEKKAIWIKVHFQGMKIRDIRDQMGISFGTVQRFSYGEEAAFARSLVYGYDKEEFDALYAEVKNQAILSKFRTHISTIPEAGLLEKFEFENMFLLFFADIQKNVKLGELKHKIAERTNSFILSRYPCGRKRRPVLGKKNIQPIAAVVTSNNNNTPQTQPLKKVEKTVTVQPQNNSWKNAWSTKV